MAALTYFKVETVQLENSVIGLEANSAALQQVQLLLSQDIKIHISILVRYLIKS
jgi:hypothetical protein